MYADPPMGKNFSEWILKQLMSNFKNSFCKKSPLKIKEEAYEKQNKKMRSDHKKETGSTLGSRQTSGTGTRRVSFACRFAGMEGSMTDAMVSQVD